MDLLKRILYSLSILWGIFTLVFLLFLPSGEEAAKMMLSQRSDSLTVQRIRSELLLDQPAYMRYFVFLRQMSPVDSYPEVQKTGQSYLRILGSSIVIKAPWLGRSYQSQRAVSQILADALPGTILLASLAMFIAVILGIGLGILSVMKKGTVWDQIILTISSLGISMPSFLAAVLIAWIFGFLLKAYTGLSMTGSWLEYDPEFGEYISWKNCLLPSITLGIRPLSIIVQLTRNSLLDVMQQDYIRTAKAKGLSPFRIWVIHGLKNAMNPVVTAITGWFASLMAGAFFVEYIFNWKGLGKVTVDALEKTDIPVVMGGILWIGVLFTLLQALADVLYKILDPRIT